MTLVCVPITVEDPASALVGAGAARAAGADLVEFRIDSLFTGAGPTGGASDRSPGAGDSREVGQIVRLVADSPLPCIMTCRSAAEGGHYDGDEDARIALFERLGTADRPPRYIDVEFSSYSRSANLAQKVNLAVQHPRQVRDLATSLILSLHDFTGRPADLTRRILAMSGEPAAAVLKVAYRARSLRDNLELFDLLTENAGGKPMIALGMGEFGLLSRVLAPKFGGFLTFASLRPETATAPGQPTIREILDLYRFRSIGAATRVYGVIGWPAAHSLSPAMHNAAFGAAGHDGVYLPLPVPPEYEHFKATMHALIDHPRLGFAGCSVTSPHKGHLVRLAREPASGGRPMWLLDDLSRVCDAANTLAVERTEDGSPVFCRVLNTDGPAAVGLLRSALGEPKGRRIAIIGAGGVARSIGMALALEGSHILLHHRTPAAAESLVGNLAPAASFGGGSAEVADRGSLATARFDAAINCTPIGMAGSPGGADLPIPVETLRNCPRDVVVFDMVYDPLETPLLNRAREAGLRTIDGLAMLVAQGAMQSEAWTGSTPPLMVLERAARERMKSTE